MPIGQVEHLQHMGRRLAYMRQDGQAPEFVWLGGFKSDMAGTKAEALAAWAARRGQAFTRFDYSGHGRSDGRFEDGTISAWLDDTLAVIDAVTAGPLVLIGSSMGGWLALLAARARAQRIGGLILIAPAADMTERLMWASFDEAVRREIEQTGRWARPSAYEDGPYVITRALIEDGRRHLIMEGPIRLPCPVRILQGRADPDVPEAHVRALAALIESPDLRFTLIADGDHRLSRDADIAVLTDLADQLAG